MKKKYFLIFFVVLFVFLGAYIGIYNYNINKKINTNYSDELSDIQNDDTEDVDYAVELSNIREHYNNDDIVGVLSLDDGLKEIVMQSSDNDYYLEHTVYHESNWRGQISRVTRSLISPSPIASVPVMKWLLLL